MRVVEFCKKEHEEGLQIPFRFFKKRASVMTGVSLSTIHRIETIDMKEPEAGALVGVADRDCGWECRMWTFCQSLSFFVCLPALLLSVCHFYFMSFCMCVCVSSETVLPIFSLLSFLVSVHRLSRYNFLSYDHFILFLFIPSFFFFSILIVRLPILGPSQLL